MVFPKHEGNGYGQMLVAEAIKILPEKIIGKYIHIAASHEVYWSI